MSRKPTRTRRTTTHHQPWLRFTSRPEPGNIMFYQKGFSQITREATGKALHGLCITGLLSLGVFLNNTLISMYSRFGCARAARHVFDEMRERNESSWNNMMSGLVRRLFEEMPNTNVVSWDFIMDGKCLDALKIFSNMLLKQKIVNYVSFTSALAACSDPELSFKARLFRLWRFLQDYTKIWSLATQYLPYEAVKAYKLMREKGLPVDYITIANVLGACLAPGNLLKHGMPIHAHIVLTGFESNKYVQNSLITMYAKCGDLNSSNYIFDGLANKNSVSWNAMIAANAHHGCGEEILKLISKMRCTGLELDQFSFSEGLAATAKLALLEEGQQLHGWQLNLPMQRARMSWNILISVFARHGYFEKARETFHEMVKHVKPDRVTFVSLLSACSHGGLVEEGLAYYTAMTKEFGVPAGIEHCKATERLFELNPSDDSAHVLYSNICATTGRWEDVENVRRQMGSNKIKKQPACSWVKLKDGVSTFGMGDKSHPQTLQIYSKLEELKKMIKEAGYVPDTSYALHDTDEEQKEQNLWDHSERVALAFGLINTPEGSTIRVFKNLRVCGDCHSVYKFISKIIRRRIILRDPYRFHHFSSGKCSCSDYW
ncbi:hypothetical protein EZV62_006199 [Acer yangbiense]|uniref:DYW domain-containing protein n=1 Tax=Acer yangbiense TaxID=1000413 RepID=A0A5C7IR20_9ROSI|nr:hypothetical protein EZV62_006199 [Acer yangbiense]